MQRLRIYMDVCCLSRPFDDLSQARIYLEAEATLSIISRCESGEWTLLSSGTIDYELSQISDTETYEKTSALYGAATEHMSLTPPLVERAKEFQSLGLKHFDSLHMAIAEGANADVFLTTDDRLIKATNRTDVGIRVSNPVIWLMEVESNE